LGGTFLLGWGRTWEDKKGRSEIAPLIFEAKTDEPPANAMQALQTKNTEKAHIIFILRIYKIIKKSI